jgi:hypothetical protein
MKSFLLISQISTRDCLLSLLLFLSSFSFAQTPVRNEQGYLLIDYDGEILTETSYDFIGEASSHLHVAVKDGRWGYLNSNGRPAIPFEYDVAYPFNGSFALVGKDERYFHINQQQQVLDTIDWPKAPLVYNKRLLLANEGKSIVYYEDGQVLLESKERLLLAAKSGIIRWDKEKALVEQYISPRGKDRLHLYKTHQEVDSVAITHEGYLCILKTKNNAQYFDVFDERNPQAIASIPAKGNHASYIKEVWKNFIYWPEGQVFHREIPMGTESHFPMQSMNLKGRSRKTGKVFQLCDKYYRDQVALLPGTEKWVPFDGNSIRGNLIFDDVVPGDEDYTPVKIGKTWQLYNKRKEKLDTQQFQYIHPIGMNDGRLFASTQNPGTFDEKWAFVNLKEGLVSEEVFAIPLERRSAFLLYENSTLYQWKKELNRLIKDGRYVYINNLGKVVWTEPSTRPLKPKDFFETELQLKPGFEELPNKHPYKKKDFVVFIQASNTGIEVHLVNATKDTLPVEIQDGYFQAQIEYKNKEGEWIKIVELEPATCGNSYYSLLFPSKSISRSQVHFPKGTVDMLIRVKIDRGNLTASISNELSVKVNKGRLWVSRYHGGFGSKVYMGDRFSRGKAWH